MIRPNGTAVAVCEFFDFEFVSSPMAISRNTTAFPRSIAAMTAGSAALIVVACLVEQLLVLCGTGLVIVIGIGCLKRHTKLAPHHYHCTVLHYSNLISIVGIASASSKDARQ